MVTNIPQPPQENEDPWFETRDAFDRAVRTRLNEELPEELTSLAVESDLRNARRAWVGAHVEPIGRDPEAGANYYLPVGDFENSIKATLDIVSYYKAVGAATAASFTAEVVPELNRHPHRKLMYALEIWRDNPTFISEFDAQTGIYPHLVSLFQAIKDSGHSDRVHLAPFHEGNGGSNYPWEMYYSSKGNSPELYKQAFQRVVTLARTMGLESPIIQWFLTSNGGSGNSQNLAEAYVGDEWVDLVGVSYYNRSGATGYYSQWLPVGAELRRFMRRMESVSGRNVWICESGCAASNNGFDKGQWYADLVRLASSPDMPRLEAVILFLRQGTTTDMTLENDSQRIRLGKAINASRRTVRYINPADFTLSLIPPAVSVPTTTSTWSVAGTGAEASITNNVPPGRDKGSTSIRVTKPASSGTSNNEYGLYRTISSGLLDFVPGQPYVMTFDARASFLGFELSAGMRQPGGDALFSGDESIPLTTEWDSYVVQFANTAADQGSWRFPYFRFGSNALPGWFELTEIRIAPGVYPRPNADKLLRPKTGVATDATNILWSSEAASLWSVTLGANRTLNVPSGVPFDGQQIRIRVTQDATGNRTLTLASGFRNSSIPLTLSTTPGATDVLTFEYQQSTDKWALVNLVRWT